MKKYSIILLFSLLTVFASKAQGFNDPVFTSVPVTNGKVIFQQFIHADKALSEDQRYALLYKWGKDKYTGNPLLSGIRFDDKARSITVSSKAELLLAANKDGVREKMLMNYRFDASITSSGCMLVIRDITYQNVQGKESSFFPKAYSAEDMITDRVVNTQDDMQEVRSNTRKATLDFLNNLYNSLNGVLEVKK